VVQGKRLLRVNQAGLSKAGLNVLVAVSLLLGLAAGANSAPRKASAGGHPAARGAGRSSSGSGGVYPQFRAPGGQIIRWISEQMPLKVYVAPGTSLDSIIDPQMGAAATNTGNKEHWPDVVANVVQNPEQLQSLPAAEGYVPDHFQAAVRGINSWKGVAQGLFSYEITQDPSDADIYVFWTKAFVNNLGLALFENDIRGYTAKRSFPLRAIAAGGKPEFKPVITLLRTTDGMNNPMPLGKMQASAAHEFGHALGIEGHSTNPNDLMSVYYGHGVISPNDAATIRYLYRVAPEYIP
jgi:predicted Zn-dependent protease